MDALGSDGGGALGGGAKSLKVVRVSDWLAEVCILSRAFAICSFSMVELADIELTESRLLRKPNCEPMDGDTGAPPATGVFGVVMLSMFKARRSWSRAACYSYLKLEMRARSGLEVRFSW